MYKFLLCSRYLRTRFIALASIISVLLGVATMIVVNSVMAGFSTQMRERIHGILADMVLEVNGTDGAPNPEAVIKHLNEVAGEYIEATSPTVEVYGMISFDWLGQRINKLVTIVGIDPVTKSRVGTLKEHLKNFQPVYENGKLVQPATRRMDEAPDWELMGMYLNYRKMRVKQLRELSEIHHHEDLQQDAEMQPQATAEVPREGPAPPPNGLNDPFQDNAPPQRELTLEEAAQPLQGRVYVGTGVVSFQYDDRKTGQKRIEMMAEPGDDVTLATFTTGRRPEVMGMNATIVDLFQCGMSEYDSNLVFMNLEYLQTKRGMYDKITGERYFTTIQIKLKNYEHADTVAARIKASPNFPPGLFEIQTWEKKQGPLLAAVAVESAILNVLLFLIIAVAGFGILAIFYMIVVEKTRDIGILKALGASSSGIQSIFLGYGFGLGIVGSGVGVLTGLLFVWNINTIESWITFLTGHKVFDDRIYYFPTIPTDIQPMMVFWVALGAMTIAMLASILPARRASQLNPVQSLRYE